MDDWLYRCVACDVCYTWLLTLGIAFLVAPRSPEVFYSLFKKMWVHCSNDNEIDNRNCRLRCCYSLLTAVNKRCTSTITTLGSHPLFRSPRRELNSCCLVRNIVTVPAEKSRLCTLHSVVKEAACLAHIRTYIHAHTRTRILLWLVLLITRTLYL